MEIQQQPGGEQPQGGLAQIRYGVYNNPGQHAGKTVKEIREGVGKVWGMPADTAAFSGKEKLSDDYVIQPGDNLEFHRRAGEKG